MYRHNYRQLIGVYKGQKMYYNSSFVSSERYAPGDKLFREEVCGEVEIHQVTFTGAVS